MSIARQDRLLGLIYDAPFEPSLWVPAMELLVEELSAESACMTSFDIVTGAGGGAAALVPEGTMEDYMAHWAHDNPLLRVDDPLDYVARWRLSILRHEDWMDRDHLNRTAYFNEFLRPLRCEHGIMIRIALSGTVTTTMNVARSLRRGIFEDAEIDRARRWQAHLVRAERMARQVRIDQVALDAIDRLLATTPQRLFFLDARGRVRRMSAAAEALPAAGDMLRIVGGLLVATLPDDDAALQRLVARATGHGGGERCGGATTVRGGAGIPHEVTVAPLGPRAAANWSGEPVVMVTVGTAGGPYLPTQLRLRTRFHLTPAEARLALALAEGGTLREAADGAGLSINTVRAQLGTIFSKTGCRRQAELVRMVLAMDRPDG